MRFRLIAVAIVSALFVTGCSTAAYQKQIGTMADGMSDAKAAFEMASEEERKGYVATQVARGMRPGNLIKLGPNCRSAGVEPLAGPGSGVDCLPLIHDAQRGETRLVFRSAAPKGLKYMSLIDDYAKTLVQLAAAQDVAAVKEGEKQVSGAIAAMATAFATPAAAVVVGAGLGVFDWFVGLYLDNQRLQELRHVVLEADPVVAKGSDLVAQEARLLQSSILSKRALDLERERAIAYDTTDRAKRQAAGEAFVAGAIALNDYATMDVGEPFEKMKKAHAELAKALKDPAISPALVFTQLKAFAKSAADLKAALEKMGAKK